ncbi:MAG TPA: hypothetical protein VGB15_01765 [Longimicrobium sp.]|jgi:hypothetical protein
MNRRWISALTMVLPGAFTAAGCGGAPPAPPPPPAPEPVAPAAPAPPTALGYPETISACVLRNGRMEVQTVRYDIATGDSTINGRQFHEAFPVTAEHAASARWYAGHEPITFAGRRFVKYGLPRLFSPDEVVSAGTYRGVTVFVETGVDPARPEVVYLAVTPRCELQPYHGSETGGAVRG